MVIAVYLPLVLSAIFGVIAPPLSRRLPPRLSMWLVSAGSAVCAVSLVVTLALLGFTAVARNPLIAEQGGWDAESVGSVSPVSTRVAITALAVLGLLTLRVAWAVWRRTRYLLAAYALAAALPCSSDELAVIDDPGLQAWAVPGRPGRIVVSSALLRTLGTDERRAVIAHERAHLRHRHHVHHAVVRLATAADPFLWRLPSVVDLAAERSADEYAAHTCSRRTVARALLHVSLASSGDRTAPAGVLGVASSEVVTRVRALHQPASRPALWRLATLLGVVALSVAAVVEAVRDSTLLFAAARAWPGR